MATKQALRKMLLPSVLALIIPIVGGLLFGPQVRGQVKEAGNLLRGIIKKFQKTPVFQRRHTDHLKKKIGTV